MAENHLAHILIEKKIPMLETHTCHAIVKH